MVREPSFEAHNSNVGLLRAEVRDVVLWTRAYLEDTRRGSEALYLTCPVEFSNLQAAAGATTTSVDIHTSFHTHGRGLQ